MLKNMFLSKVDPDVDLRDEGYRFVVLLERENGKRLFYGCSTTLKGFLLRRRFPPR
ncbi:MAG: hypothetical protein ACLU4N_05065 [Butyricimonas faecihominis]